MDTNVSTNTGLLQAVNFSAPSYEPGHPYYESRMNTIHEDPVRMNKVYREGHQPQASELVTIKAIARPRIYGTRHSGGSVLAKSAIRLAIDTGVKEPSVFLNSDLKAKDTVKVSLLGNFTREDAVDTLDSFEKAVGGKASSLWNSAVDKYYNKKHEVLDSLGLVTLADGRPAFHTDEQRRQYFEEMQHYSFIYWELYLSAKPQNKRATKTRSYYALGFVDIQKTYPDITWD